MKRTGKGSTPVKSNGALAKESSAVEGKPGKSWAETDGTGDRDGFMGFSGGVGKAISLIGTLSLLICCPVIVMLL
jgi:hypothetical protein